MAVRDEVINFISMGPLPDSDMATAEQVDELGAAIDKITRPVTHEEAEMLMSAFGPDECFGLAWDLVHLIETAPGGAPISSEPPPDANEWVRHLWTTAQNGRRWRKTK